ncbi:MAG: glycosyltransferase family 39 protein, partial [Anaerolineales bacterium]|nr:glycosyltransferase family 39 protein [Anaerolineales bacterium]
MKTAKWLGWAGFVLIVLVFAVYAARFIERTSFEVDGTRYYALFDDAMISMRYAKNLANGYGPVWNPGGERVEGFSNPLWVGLMAVFHLFPIPAHRISMAVQIAGAVFLAANLLFVKLIADELTDNRLVVLLAVFLTAFYFPLNNWSIQGMEVGLQTLLVSLAAWLSLRAYRRERFTPWPYLILGLGTWVRIDMGAALLVLLVFQLLFDRENRKSHLLWGLGALLGFMLAQTLARYLYYGELLPNTYYLKVGGTSTLARLSQGLMAFFITVWTGNWVLFVVPFALLLLQRDKAVLLPFALFLGQSAYSIYVGGDAWEHTGGANRFISIGMPLFFVLFALTLDAVRTALLRVFEKDQRSFQPPNWLKLGTQALMAAFVVVSLFSFNTLLEQDGVQKWMLIKRPPYVKGSERYVRMGLSLAEATTSEARIAVVTAGNMPYFAGERYFIDLLGKSDKVVARQAPQVVA